MFRIIYKKKWKAKSCKMFFRISRRFYLSFKCMTFLLGWLLKKKSKVNIIWKTVMYLVDFFIKNISREIIGRHLRFTRTWGYESDDKIFNTAKVAVVRICSSLRRSRFKELALLLVSRYENHISGNANV